MRETTRKFWSIVLVLCFAGCSGNDGVSPTSNPDAAEQADSLVDFDSTNDVLISGDLTGDFTDADSVDSSSTPDADLDTTSVGCTEILPANDPPLTRYETIVQPFDLVLESGNRVYGLVRRPDIELAEDACLPAVVWVPGGVNPGRMEAYSDQVILLAEAGVVVVSFNSEGRGGLHPDEITSEGEEDLNGHRDQDGLCQVVSYTAGLQGVSPGNVGVITQSFGISMGAGCVARHPEIPVAYLVDGEGPPSSFVTCHEPLALDDDPDNDKYEIVFELLGRYSAERDPSEENVAFWEERDAINYIGQIQVPYLRLQAEYDHAQPPRNDGEIEAFEMAPEWYRGKHTVDIVNAAVDGGVPWVRVNLAEQGNAVNATYDADNRPVFLPNKLADRPWRVRAVLEMIAE